MSEMTLRMPSSYVDIDRDEMEYVDGGNAFTNWLFSVNTVGAAIDVAISTLIPTGAIAGYVSKVGTKNAARFLESVVVNKLKSIGIAVAGATVLYGLEFALSYFDVGYRLADYLDSIDASPNNNIVWF